MTEEKKKPETDFNSIIVMLKEEVPDKKSILNALKNGLKPYQKTTQQIVQDIAMDYIAFKKGELSDDPAENEEWYNDNVDARKTALELYAIKALEDELSLVKDFLVQLSKAGIPYVSPAAGLLIAVLETQG